MQGDKKDLWRTHYSCVALHNFIRRENRDLDDGLVAEYITEEISDDENNLLHLNVDDIYNVDDEACKFWRDEIAQDMWNSYLRRNEDENAC